MNIGRMLDRAREDRCNASSYVCQCVTALRKVAEELESRPSSFDDMQYASNLSELERLYDDVRLARQRLAIADTAVKTIERVLRS